VKLLQKLKNYWTLGNPFRTRIAYVGWTGHQNFGDEMLYQAYQRLFPEYHVLPFVKLSPGKKGLYKKITGRDVFAAGCLGGGTLINRSKGRLKTFSKLLDACPVCFCLGTGVANAGFWEGRGDWGDELKRWVELLKRCQFVGVRGPVGAEMLRQAGLKDVKVVGDSALAFARESCATPEEKTVGVNVGTALGNVWGTEEEMVERIALACKALRAKGWNILFWCVWPSDMDATKALAKQIGVAEQKIHLITNDVEDALDLCGRCTTFIGMKLHSVVTAICAGVPSIMIEYRPKCRDFMASLGLEEFVVRSDSIDVDQLVSMSESLAAERSAVQTKMRARISECKERLTNGAGEIKRIIEDRARETRRSGRR